MLVRNFVSRFHPYMGTHDFLDSFVNYNDEESCNEIFKIRKKKN
jgi:hypothetical protein